MRSGAGLAGVLGRPVLPPALPDGSTGGATTSGVGCCAAGAAAEVGWASCSSGTQKRTCARVGASSNTCHSFTRAVDTADFARNRTALGTRQRAAGAGQARTHTRRPRPPSGVSSALPPSGNCCPACCACCCCRRCCRCSCSCLSGTNCTGFARLRLLLRLGTTTAGSLAALELSAAGGRQKPGKLSAPSSCNSCLLLTSCGDGGCAAPSCWGVAAAGLACRLLWTAGQMGRHTRDQQIHHTAQTMECVGSLSQKRSCGSNGASHRQATNSAAAKCTWAGCLPKQAQPRTFCVQLQGGLWPRLLQLLRAGRLRRSRAMPVPAWLGGVASQVHKQAAHLHRARRDGNSL